MPASGIRKSSSSNVPLPPSGAMPKSFSKKSTHISFSGEINSNRTRFLANSHTEPRFDIRIGRAGPNLSFLETYGAKDYARQRTNTRSFTRTTGLLFDRREYSQGR
jgi:hypothetical protein